jgi:CMP-N,N'-diacetyllegionaminic acid synthase
LASNEKAPELVALIPARGGSVRVPGKNTRALAGHPLIAYTISAALDSGVFAKVVVSTDEEKTAEIGRHYGAEAPFLRPSEYSESTSPDIDFVVHALDEYKKLGTEFDGFSILRPTSPFRKPQTIQRAWSAFQAAGPNVDSLRAVERCNDHPMKMWVIRGKLMHPLFAFGPQEQPWHSSQYPTLPEIYVQNASLEIAWSRVALEDHTIAGETIMPFLTVDDEGIDVNNKYDWAIVEQMIEAGDAVLPEVHQPPYSD